MTELGAYETHALNRIMTVPIARWAAVMCKRWDLPLSSLACMMHESQVLDGYRTITVMGQSMNVSDWNWEVIDNPLTWTMLFGWVPAYLQQKERK